MRNNIILLLILITTLISCKPAVKNNVYATHSSNFQKTIDSIYHANPKSIGIMVHIESPKDNMSWSGCSGYSNKDLTAKLTPDQPALIASCIKPYISASLLRLQELGLLNIEDSIGKHLSDETVQLFEKAGYDFEIIKIKHLLSHTSGIRDYADQDYLNWIDKNQKHRWTREEQLKLTVSKGRPLGKPKDIFKYADANFLLCAEIIESNTNKPFYTAIRELLKYKEQGFTNTWFPTLEEPDSKTKPLAHQYWGERNWDSYKQDVSYDLYGGGGIATTTEELAKFSYNLFEGSIIKDSLTLNKIFTKIIPSDVLDTKYHLGLRSGNINGYDYYYHAGFWGTTMLYFPELETSMAVYILEKDKFPLVFETQKVLLNQLTKLRGQQ